MFSRCYHGFAYSQRLMQYYIIIDFRREKIWLGGGWSDQVRHKSACSTTATSMYQVYMLCSQESKKGANQTARMRRLVCAFVVRMQQSGFLATWPITF